MILSWIKCTGDQWCDFFNLNLNHPHFDTLEGVYIIWHGAPNPLVVYVGQGNIRERILTHRSESVITKYKNSGLYVTWASVSSTYRDRVERYLTERWHPLVGGRQPHAAPTPVNSPW